MVAELVRDPRIDAAMSPETPDLAADREQRSALAARLEAFESDYALGNITGLQLAKATATVEVELAKVDARLAKGLSRSASSSVLRVPDPGQAFLDAQIDIQRAVLASVLRLDVLPALSRGWKWSAERLEIARPS
jgi:hypothetical protein